MRAAVLNKIASPLAWIELRNTYPLTEAERALAEFRAGRFEAVAVLAT